MTPLLWTASPGGQDWCKSEYQARAGLFPKQLGAAGRWQEHWTGHAPSLLRAPKGRHSRSLQLGDLPVKGRGGVGKKGA